MASTGTSDGRRGSTGRRSSRLSLLTRRRECLSISCCGFPCSAVTKFGHHLDQLEIAIRGAPTPPVPRNGDLHRRRGGAVLRAGYIRFSRTWAESGSVIGASRTVAADGGADYLGDAGAAA